VVAVKDSWPLYINQDSPNDPVFVGIGEIPSGRYPDRSFIGDLTKVGLLAIADAGMVPTDIDTIMLIPNLHSFDDQADLVFSRMVEELGLSKKAKSSFMVHSGGSTSDNAVRAASGLIATGHARSILVLQCEHWGSAEVSAMIHMLTKNGIPQEWEQVAGLQFNAIGALITKRYMYESQSTPEEMASILVTLRKWANLNPNAMFRDKRLTIEQVLGSRMVSDPLHAMECPMLADGAVAFVMTSAANAKDRGIREAVRVAGSGGCVSHYSIGQELEVGKLGWEIAAGRAYQQSGWKPDTADFAEIYDSYAAVTAIAIEGLGIAAKGEGARWFAAGTGDPGGEFPINTNGGLLSAGHTGVGGGTALLVEGVRQLLWKAEEPRQIAGCRRCVIGGSGGSYMDAQVLMLERVEYGS
jgi:acetyl-CoA C-acetyltransferase